MIVTKLPDGAAIFGDAVDLASGRVHCMCTGLFFNRTALAFSESCPIVEVVVFPIGAAAAFKNIKMKKPIPVPANILNRFLELHMACSFRDHFTAVAERNQFLVAMLGLRCIKIRLASLGRFDFFDAEDTLEAEKGERHNCTPARHQKNPTA